MAVSIFRSFDIQSSSDNNNNDHLSHCPSHRDKKGLCGETMSNHMVLVHFPLLFLLILASFTNARPLEDNDGDAEANVLYKCHHNDEDRLSYYWKVWHRDRPYVVHHLYGYLALEGQLHWDELPPTVKTDFAASDVTVFESNAAGLKDLQECIRVYAEREAPLSTTLTERLDAYFNASSEYNQTQVLRNWRTMSTGWLLAGLLHLLVDEDVTSLLEARASRDKLWHAPLLHQAELLLKGVEYIEQIPERCNILHSVDQPKLELGIENLMEELEALAHATTDTHMSTVERIIELYECGQFGHMDDIISMQFRMPLPVTDNKANLRLLNAVLLQALVRLRNRRWMSRIGEMLQGNKLGQSYFIALNSIHFLSPNDSLTEFLRERGFHVFELRPYELPGNNDNSTAILPGTEYSTQYQAQQHPYRKRYLAEISGEFEESEKVLHPPGTKLATADGNIEQYNPDEDERWP